MRLAILLLTLPGLLPAQTSVEAAPAARRSIYPSQWPPGPTPDSVPAWARPGMVRFARFDGGPLETAKAMLSGWPGFNPPIPDYVYAMTNWYQPSTIGLLREAGINLIWVTFSNGFSIPTELPQQEMLRLYIDECHRQGIRVMAYASIANMFWEDMYERVPESRNWLSLGKDGKPVAYSAGRYAAMGRVTRYMADLANPAWRDYLRRRIDLAIDAGADGVMYDNNFGEPLFDTYREIYAYAAARKRDFLLMANFHSNTYAFNRLLNAITTEDAVEPGVYAEAKPEWAMPVAGGALVNNIGLHRIHSALAQGWKPAMIEPGLRELDLRGVHDQRMVGPMSAERYSLAMAESMMFSISTEAFVEGGFAHGLFRREPGAMDVWRGIGRYNRFFRDNQAYYTGTRSLAPLAVVLDDRSATVPMLNSLAARNVIFDVLYEHDLTHDTLAPYDAVALLTAETVRDTALAALGQYVAKRGRLFAAANAAAFDENGRPRPRPALFARATLYDRLPPLDELAQALRSAVRAPAVRVDAPPGVLYNAVAQSAAGRVIVHLLNYTLRPAPALKVVVRERFDTATLLSPDSPRSPARIVSATELEVPAPVCYSILVLETKP